MTMKTPEMEVVRFEEADVIVASGFATKFGSVQNAGGTKGDLKVTINGHSYNYDTLATGINDGIYAGLGSINCSKDSNSKSLKKLFDDDENNGAYDGYYESYDDGFNYIWKRQ